jgi:glycosyl hydrolase family 2
MRGRNAVKRSFVSLSSPPWIDPTSSLAVIFLRQSSLREGKDNDLVGIEAQLLDANEVLCLDARNQVRFGIAGDGTLIDDLGTATGSRVVELYNGRALIRVKLNHGKSEVSASSKDLPTAFLQVV